MIACNRDGRLVSLSCLPRDDVHQKRATGCGFSRPVGNRQPREQTVSAVRWARISPGLVIACGRFGPVSLILELVEDVFRLGPIPLQLRDR